MESPVAALGCGEIGRWVQPSYEREIVPSLWFLSKRLAAVIQPSFETTLLSVQPFLVGDLFNGWLDQWLVNLRSLFNTPVIAIDLDAILELSHGYCRFVDLRSGQTILRSQK